MSSEASKGKQMKHVTMGTKACGETTNSWHQASSVCMCIPNHAGARAHEWCIAL